MFSVIIPLYNKENYIKRALTSVLNQTYSGFEVIIVNDGSTDRSLEILESIKDNRIRIISQKNCGVSSARNMGIDHARNQFIAFLDADDTWHPEFLEIINELIRSNPEAGVYYSNYKLIKEKKDEVSYSVKNLKNQNILIEDYFDFVVKNKTICASSVVIKKEVFKVIGKFPVKLKRGEDLYLWTKIALKYKVAYTNFVGAFYYRDVPESLTRKKFNIEYSFSNIAEEFYLENKEQAINHNSFREYMIQIIISKSMYLIKQNNKEEARLLLKRYSDTKFYKKKVIILYILSYFPKSIINILT